MKILNTLLIFFFTLNLTAFAKPKEHNMNPLLTHGELPDFNAIKPEHFDPAIDALIKSFNNTLNNVNREHLLYLDWIDRKNMLLYLL